MKKRSQPATAVSKPARKAKVPQSGQKVSRTSKVKKVGQVTHYFGKIKVCVVRLGSGGLRSGQRIRFLGKSTDFSQKLASMQIESVDVKAAKRGQLVGIQVQKVVREGDEVYALMS